MTDSIEKNAQALCETVDTIVKTMVGEDAKYILIPIVEERDEETKTIETNMGVLTNLSREICARQLGRVAAIQMAKVLGKEDELEQMMAEANDKLTGHKTI